MEPLNKGDVGTRSFSFIQRLKCTGIIGIGTSRFERRSLFGVSFIGGSTIYL